jgi:hypothetical protein
LREQEAVAARALEFLILTAARTGEVIGARWNENRCTLVFEAIGSDMVRVNCASWDDAKVILDDQALEVVAIG